MIYLDNGATSFPKPPAVAKEVEAFMTEYGGNPGRGGHTLSMRAAEMVFECRDKVSRFFGISDPARAFFGMNTTHILNTVIKGILKDGDHAIISDMEHNAVYRPIYKMADEGRITYDTFSVTSAGKRRNDEEILSDIQSKIGKKTKLLICIFSSNICSIRLPIEKIGKLCREKGILFAVDGAQGAGHEMINIKQMNIDVLCVPGHKGLYGPQGCAVGLIDREMKLDILIEGGNGVDSLLGEMSEELPERMEAGTLPTPAICGLLRGIEAIEDIGVKNISEREHTLFKRCREMLDTLSSVKIYFPEEVGSVLMFNISGLPSDYVSAELDRRGICTRGGYHCCALGHSAIGTLESGGVRVSFGMYNKPRDTERLWKALKEIIHDAK